MKMFVSFFTSSSPCRKDQFAVCDFLGDRNWIPCAVIGLIPSKYSKVLSQIVPSRVTSARIFCEGAVQRINKQNGVRHFLRRRWINSISIIIPNHFDNNSEYEDRECNSDHVTEVRVFLTNPVTKRCWWCRAMNIPHRTKKNLRGKGGRQVNNNNNNNKIYV